MDDWVPRKRHGVALEFLALSARDGFLLSRIDGRTSTADLCRLTGWNAAEVNDTLVRLSRQGVLFAPPAPAQPPASSSSQTRYAPSFSAANAAALASRDTVASRCDRRTPAAPSPGAADDAADDAAALTALDLSPLPSLVGDDTLEGGAVFADADAHGDGRASKRQPNSEDPDQRDVVAVVLANLDSGPTREPREGAHGPFNNDATNDVPQDDDGAHGSDEPGESSDPDDEGAAAQPRAHYRATFAALPVHERVAHAQSASGASLLALCFDPVGAVIGAVVDNPLCALVHARLVARHHTTTTGLDRVVAHAAFVRDTQVQKFLLMNPIASDGHVRAVFSAKRLEETYRWALSRELPEKNRTKVRLLLRHKWSVADGEARAQLVLGTEGRALPLLVGLPMDGQTTMLLCARTVNSVMLVQQLARFSATPPQVLVHLLKQPLLKRQPHLRALVAQHPNCPADAKRKAREG
jgi:hypothetical protein